MNKILWILLIYLIVNKVSSEEKVDTDDVIVSENEAVSAQKLLQRGRRWSLRRRYSSGGWFKSSRSAAGANRRFLERQKQNLIKKANEMAIRAGEKMKEIMLDSYKESLEGESNSGAQLFNDLIDACASAAEESILVGTLQKATTVRTNNRRRNNRVNLECASAASGSMISLCNVARNKHSIIQSNADLKACKTKFCAATRSTSACGGHPLLAAYKSCMKAKVSQARLEMNYLKKKLANEINKAKKALAEKQKANKANAQYQTWLKSPEGLRAIKSVRLTFKGKWICSGRGTTTRHEWHLSCPTCGSAAYCRKDGGDVCNSDGACPPCGKDVCCYILHSNYKRSIHRSNDRKCSEARHGTPMMRGPTCPAMTCPKWKPKSVLSGLYAPSCSDGVRLSNGCPKTIPFRKPSTNNCYERTFQSAALTAVWGFDGGGKTCTIKINHTGERGCCYNSFSPYPPNPPFSPWSSRYLSKKFGDDGRYHGGGD